MLFLGYVLHWGKARFVWLIAVWLIAVCLVSGRRRLLGVVSLESLILSRKCAGRDMVLLFELGVLSAGDFSWRYLVRL